MDEIAINKPKTLKSQILDMQAGMCLFVLLNYFGQRFFAFKTEESSSDSDTN